MAHVTFDALQGDIAAYLKRVEDGETLLITKAGKPMAELKPVTSSSHAIRPYGLCAGDFVVPDDFGEPLPDDMIEAFEGK